MATDKQLIDEFSKDVDKAIARFEEDIPNIEASVSKRVASLTKDLDLQGDNLKRSVENLRKIQRIKAEVKNVILSEKYKSNVQQLLKSIDKITAKQAAYFKQIEGSFTSNEFAKELRTSVKKSVVQSLTAEGLEVNVVEGVEEILRQNITEAVSFDELQKNLRDHIRGTSDRVSKIGKHIRQIVTDSISEYSAQLNKVITDDLGLEWFRYVGGLVEDSRPFCVALVEKEYIHESEIRGILNGVIDGERVSLEGLKPDTTPVNFQTKRGGYNCNHLLVPVSTASVPKRIRDKIK